MIATANNFELLELSVDELDLVDGGNWRKAVIEFCVGVVEGFTLAH